MIDLFVVCYWCVMNESVCNVVGELVVYKFVLFVGLLLLVVLDLSVGCCAVFVCVYLWVMCYVPDELYVVGDYFN